MQPSSASAVCSLGELLQPMTSFLVLDDRGYAAVLAVVVVTTLVTPPALQWTMRRRDRSRS